MVCEGLSQDVLSAFDPHAKHRSPKFFLESPAGLAASDLVARAKVLPADISSQLVALLALSGREKTLLEIGQGEEQNHTSSAKCRSVKSCAAYNGN